MKRFNPRRHYGIHGGGHRLSGKTRTFGPKRLRLRHAALALVCAGALMTGLSWGKGDTENAPQHAQIDARTDIVPVFAADASPAARAQLAGNAAADSLHDVFTASIPAAAPVYDQKAAAAPPRVKTASLIPMTASAAANGLGRAVDATGALLNKTLTVGKGDTLMSLLTDNDVPRTQAHNAIEALKKVYDPRRLHPQNEVTVFFHRAPEEADPQFRGLSIEKDVITTVEVSRTPDGDYQAQKKDKKIESRLRSYAGMIDNSLYVSAGAAGMPDYVTIDLIRMYSWGIDFQRDIQPGDSFEVLYREYATEDGNIVPGKGEILYARLKTGERDMPYYLFTDSAGEKDYFDEQGQSAKKTLMRTPIDGARLSSGFGMRHHPVLGYNKMHKGVDFAAPRGTPIYAAGDGTIAFRGVRGAYGNYIRIRHRNGLETAYAHMNGFKAGQGVGTRVKQGQVIGYVGTTGRSTGPHLHYEVLVDNKQINPRSIKLPTGKALAGQDLKKFKSQMAQTNLAFKKQNTLDAQITTAHR